MDLHAAPHSTIFVLFSIILSIDIITAKNGNPCVSNPCKNDGSCKRSKGKIEDYMCECDNGWMGPRCESSDSTLTIDITTTVPVELTTTTATTTIAMTTTQTEATNTETKINDVLTTADATSDTTPTVTDVNTSYAQTKIGDATATGATTMADTSFNDATTTVTNTIITDNTTTVADATTNATTALANPTTTDAPESVAEITTIIGTSSINSTPVFGTTSEPVTAPGKGVTVVIFPPLKQVKKSDLEAEDGLSESDQRASAITFGITSVGIMCLVIGVIVLFDLITAWHHMKRLNCIGNIRNFRNITLKEMCMECWCSKSKIFRKKRKRFRMTYVIYKYRQYQKRNGGPDVTFGTLFMMVFGVVIGKIKTFCCSSRKLDIGSKSNLINNNTDSFDHIVNDQTEENKNSDQEMSQLEYESVEHMNKLYANTKGIEDKLEEEQEHHQSDVEEFDSVVVMGFDDVDTEIGTEYVKDLDGPMEFYDTESNVCIELNDQDSDNYDLDEHPTTVENMTTDDWFKSDDKIDITEHEHIDIESIDNYNFPEDKSYELENNVDDEFEVNDKMETDSNVTFKFSNDGSDEELSILDETVHSTRHMDIWDSTLEQCYGGSSDSLKASTSENPIKVLENDMFNTDTASNETKRPYVIQNASSENEFRVEFTTNKQNPKEPNLNGRKHLSPDNSVSNDSEVSLDSEVTFDSGVSPDGRVSLDSDVTPDCGASPDNGASLGKADARSVFSCSFSNADYSPRPTKEFLFPDSTQDWRMLSSSLPSRYFAPIKNMKRNDIWEYASDKRRDSSNDLITKPGAPKVVCWHDGYDATAKPPKDWMKIVRNDLKDKSRDRSFVMSTSLQKKRSSLPSLSIIENIHNDLN